MKSRHYFVLIAMCGLAAAAIGVTMNTAGVFYAPMAESLGVGRGSAAMSLTITALVASVFALIVPKYIRESNLKINVIIATILLAGSCVLISRCESIWQIYVCSVLRGVGDGMINFVLITMIVNFWFYAKRGTFTSIVMATSGIPGVILSPVFSNIIAQSGWRTGYLWAAGFTLLCCLPAILLPISLHPEKAGLKPYGYEEFEKAKEAGRTLVIPGNAPAFNFFSVKFILAVVICCSVSTLAAVPSHFPGYATSLGHAASVGAMMLSVSMVFNIGFKLVYGIMNDRIGPSKSILIMGIINAAACCLLLFVTAEWALYIGAGMFASAFAVGAVGIAMLSGYLFGVENYATAYPVLSLLGGVSNALASTLVGSLYDVTGSYTVNFWLSLSLQVILILSLLAATAIRRNERHSGMEAAT